ncbi:MAG: excinuclease ABC subunit UvrC [Clostridia bacterium]|nr:excinuclease ABC subunit UvrC [Clostridia bacterium]
MTDIVSEKLALLPSAPGVYIMKNAAGDVIYVGKAVSLKNRVRQYFQSSKNHTAKVRAMVAQIADFDTVRVANETEALTLESNLIKRYRPYYNILLKDDKHFPYVRVDLKQDYPRVEIVRRVKKDGARYLGPFLSGLLLSDNMRLVRDYFPIRHCKKDIARAIARRERPCLMHHLGKCCAPCSGKVSRESYHALLEEVLAFLDGHTDELLRAVRAQMLAASEAMEFERAAVLRDRLRAIESLTEKQSVIQTAMTRCDVFALGRVEGNTVVYALFVRDGKVVGTERYRMDAAEEESDADVLAAFLSQHYAESPRIMPEVLLYQPASNMAGIETWLTSLAGRRVSLHVPQRGEKRRLTELAYRNCLDALEKDASLQKRAWERGEGALAQLTGLLGLESLPARIECFDNSHIMGRDSVSSMVVFTSGQPDKSAYRRFRLRTATGGDDIAAMREALSRRFARASAGDSGFAALPDLLIVDGGQAQLNAALEVLGNFSLDYLPVIGLAETNESIYMPQEPEPLELPKHSASLHLIERIRDEAHRFAISYHRSLRQKKALFSMLDTVPGIGEKRKRALFDAFVTLDAMKAADIDTLSAVPTMDRKAAAALRARFDAEERG